MDNTTQSTIEHRPSPSTLQILRLLDAPDLFRAVVDQLDPSPLVTVLKLWGTSHGVYPGDALPPAELDDLVAWADRLLHGAHPTV
jgi:hypothetical protein